MYVRYDTVGWSSNHRGKDAKIKTYIPSALKILKFFLKPHEVTHHNYAPGKYSTVNEYIFGRREEFIEACLIIVIIWLLSYPTRVVIGMQLLFL